MEINYLADGQLSTKTHQVYSATGSCRFYAAKQAASPEMTDISIPGLSNKIGREQEDFY